MKEILVKVYQLPKIDIPFNDEEYLHKLDSMEVKQLRGATRQKQMFAFS